jgi:hypothetical protein
MPDFQNTRGERNHKDLRDVNPERERTQPEETNPDAPDTNVDKVEVDMLANAADTMVTPDQVNLDHAQVDKTDDEGEPLNETVNLSGDDLDVPGSEDDDDNEEIGEEDEENNSYSLPDKE